MFDHPQPAPLGYLFDMDGTIVDNMMFHEKSWKLFLDKYGIAFTPEEFHSVNQGNIDEIMLRIFGEQVPAAERKKLGAEKEALYRDIYRSEVAPIPGLLDFLESAKSAGLRIGMATMANILNADIVLDGLGVRSFFDTVVTGEMVRRGKPHPEVFDVAMQQLGITPKQTLIFEDSHPGIHAAVASGAWVVGITTTHQPDEIMGWGAHHQIRNYLELQAGSWPLF